MTPTTALPQSYSVEDIRCIGRELNLPERQQEGLRKRLEAQAEFYRTGEESRSVIPTAQVLGQLRSLQNVVRKIRTLSGGTISRSDTAKLKRARARVLAILGGKAANLDDVRDGAFQEFLLPALCSGDNQDALEADLIEAIITLITDDAADATCAAADLLDRRILQGLRFVKRARGMTVRPGHSGDPRVNGWFDSMLRVYSEFTGRPIATSLDPRDGTPTGPLIRFLQLAGRPLGIEKSEQAWRGAIRESPLYKAARRAQKKV